MTIENFYFRTPNYTLADFGRNFFTQVFFMNKQHVVKILFVTDALLQAVTLVLPKLAGEVNEKCFPSVESLLEF